MTDFFRRLPDRVQNRGRCAVWIQIDGKVQFDAAGVNVAAVVVSLHEKSSFAWATESGKRRAVIVFHTNTAGKNVKGTRNVKTRREIAVK